jgi:hypothetical protein
MKQETEWKSTLGKKKEGVEPEVSVFFVLKM